MKKKLITLCSLLLTFASVHLNAASLGTAFTYQGRLTDGGNPANGTIPMVFGLWDAAMSGNNVGSPSSISANVPVANGLFTIDLDFGAGAFSGDARWLELRVNGTLLTTRQRVAPTPNALYALTAGTVPNGAIRANQLGTASEPLAGQILGYNSSGLVWQTPGGPNLWSVNGANAYYNGGNVGIGTAGPSGKLTVATLDDTTPTFITAFDGRHALIGTASEGVGLSYSTTTGTGYISALAPSVAWKDLVLQAKTLSFNPSGGTAKFSVLNDGNVGIGGDISFGNQTRQNLNLWGTQYGIGVQAATLYQRTDGAFAWHKHGTHSDNYVDPGAEGSTLMMLDDNFLMVRGGGNEKAYLGGDGSGNDIQVGSLNPTVQKVVMYNAALGNVMSLVSGPLTALGNGDAGQVTLTLSGVKPSILFDGDDEINNFKAWLVQLGGNGPGGPGNLEFYVIDKDERTTEHVLTMARNGNVGIGTIAPRSKLQVNQGGNGGVGVFAGDRTPFGAALFETDVTTPGTHAWFAENGNRVFSVEGGGNGYFRGNVGIGTGTPTQALDVRDGTGAGGQGGHVHVGGTGANGDPKLIKFGDGDYVHIGENGADDTMELKASRFVFTGGGVTVPVLTITGGADLAEPFPMSSRAIPHGAAVVIDETNPGQLKISERAYDHRVAGIVSGANGIKPGITLHQEGALEGGQNVALSGRVYVQSDASFGAIKPGDLLTTSDTPGHAMKVMDHDRAHGAILGKAMSALKEGKGMVLVLVTLQ